MVSTFTFTGSVFTSSVATTILNAAPGKVLLQEVYDSVDILCVNETEVRVSWSLLLLMLCSAAAVV